MFRCLCARKEHPIQHDTYKGCYNTLCLPSERRCELVSFVQSQYLEEDLRLIAVAQRWTSSQSETAILNEQ